MSRDGVEKPWAGSKRTAGLGSFTDPQMTEELKVSSAEEVGNQVVGSHYTGCNMN